MKFLFINPRRVIEKQNIWSTVSSVTPPLGLATLAAVLEQDGHVADIIDGAALDLDIPAIVSKISPDVDMIGLTATTPEIHGAVMIARAIRDRFPRARIIFGGVHPTVYHHELVERRDCDIVVRGEGENTVRAIANGEPMESIPNITWRTAQGAVVENEQSNAFVNLDELPFPAYGKLPMQSYRSAIGAAKRSPSIGMITSRGCPGTCTFCYSGMFGTKIRFMSAERVFEHIDSLRTRYGIREISFYDDTFTASRKRVDQLCTLLTANKTDISWSCFARVDTVTPEILRIMKKAGCHQICYGFESADEGVLQNINKRISEKNVWNAATWTREAGIDIRGAFMLGNPGETEESIGKTIDYSRDLGIQFSTFNIATPFPGTAMFAWAQKEGVLGHENWDLYDLAHPVLELPTVSTAVVQDCYYRAYREFYLRPSYIVKRLLSIRTGYEMMMYVKAFMGIVSLLAAGKSGSHAER